ncbi:MAG: hypothetical protein KKD39_03265 [Candidatus Altiarchaeota archaeon]|nr:hypothetical protein [Candidatus Altiarchaeota archaeon]
MDSEIYRSVNDIYGEVSRLGGNVGTLNDTMRQMLEEIKGLRKDLQQAQNRP